MWLERFLDAMSSLSQVEVFSPEQEKVLLRLNPAKFYMENIRSLLGVSSGRARLICDTAVGRGVFDRGVEVLAPDGVVVVAADHESQLPGTVHYWVEHDGQMEEAETATDDLMKQPFYRLIDAREDALR